MSSTIGVERPAPTVGRLGQGTAVEQSRATAEVQAAIVLAQQQPRNVNQAIAEMEESCRQEILAKRAFFRYNRGDGNVTGATVHLARELARCWRNVQYGLVEMRRDDEFGQSEMQAWAWDVQANTRVSSTFIVPHTRSSKKDGVRQVTQLLDARDIYENNANNGARRVREMIFSVLPPWYVEAAKDLCNATLRHGGGIPLPQRIAEAIKAYEGKGIRLDQLEAKLARASAGWSDHDVAQLHIIFTSIERGETRVEDEFPPARVTAEEIAASVPKAKPAKAPAHTDHDPGALDSECPGCRYESAAADQKAAEQ